MPIIVQKAWYTREQLQSQPNDLFAWGDNLARVGGKNNPKSGQAFACRDEPNAVGIPSKLRPSMDTDAFFTDRDYDRAKAAFDEGFIRMANHLAAGGTVIWPADGIGTGRAQLAQRAPRVWAYLERCRERLFSLAPVEHR
jgi:hypothetical protein